MNCAQVFDIDYKSSPEELYYSIKGGKKYFEFDARSKDEVRFISENGVDIIVSKRKSLLNQDLKLSFKMDPNFHDIEFVETNDASGFKVKGRYEATPINWTWKSNPAARSYELVDNAKSNMNIAEIKGLTLRKQPEVQLTIQNLENDKLEEIIIGTACLVFYTHNIKHGCLTSIPMHAGCIVS